MDILIAASEAVPFCKTGGLADVVGALAQILGKMGHQVRLFLPSYRMVEAGAHSLHAVPGQFLVPIGDEAVPATLLSTSWGSVTVYFIRNSRYFSREELYQESGKDYVDNDERFIFFSRAVLEGAKYVGFKPDVIHCHDWQTALIPAYLRSSYRMDAFYARTGTLLTIHNIAYQGTFEKDALFLAGFRWADFTPERLEYYGKFSFLKSGLVYADLLSTVSPTYAAEIQNSKEYGRGLEGLLRHRSKDLQGILNGLDADVWSPETDPHIAKNYSLDDVREGKNSNRRALRQEVGLSQDAQAPLLGIVSRLDQQKGLDLVLNALPGLVSQGAQMAVVGAGDLDLHQAFAQAADRFRGSVHFHSDFDEAFSHRVYAASDLFLMPSRFEPCGLGQMIAMRYGAIPVVTHTGGLADTVRESGDADRDYAVGAAGREYDLSRGGDLKPNGFVAAHCSQADWEAALGRALLAFSKRDAWAQWIVNAMSGEFSWEASAGKYLDLYRQVKNKVSS